MQNDKLKAFRTSEEPDKFNAMRADAFAARENLAAKREATRARQVSAPVVPETQRIMERAHLFQANLVKLLSPRVRLRGTRIIRRAIASAGASP